MAGKPPLNSCMMLVIFSFVSSPEIGRLFLFFCSMFFVQSFTYWLLFLDLVNNKIHALVMWDWCMIIELARFGKTCILSQVEGLCLVNVFCFESPIYCILGLPKVLTEDWTKFLCSHLRRRWCKDCTCRPKYKGSKSSIFIVLAHDEMLQIAK
jgi:hypothetical protein